MNFGIINDREIILTPNLENGTHLSFRTYRSRDLGDRNYQGHHWSRVLVSGLSSHRMGNRIMYTEGKETKETLQDIICMNKSMHKKLFYKYL